MSKKISELTETLEPKNNDLIPIVSDGETKKSTLLSVTNTIKTILNNDYASLNHLHDDRYYTEEEVDVKINELENQLDGSESVLPTQKASGENVYIEDAQNYPLISLKGEGKSIQEVDPTPENPQEIKVINETSYIGIGSNFYNVNDVTKKTEGITVDEDGWITATYDNTNGTSTKYLNYYTSNLKIQEATQYAIFTEIKSVSGNGTLLPISTDWKTPPNEGQFRQDLKYTFSSVSNGVIKKTIQTSESNFSALKQVGLRSFVQFATGESGSITFRISVIKDTNVTPENFVYESYKESTVAIDLKGNELASAGTVTDKLLVDRKGNIAIEKNIAKVVLNGSESWNVQQTGTPNWFYSLSNFVRDKILTFNEGNNMALSNYFISNFIATSNTNEGMYIDSNKETHEKPLLRIRYGNEQSLTSFKTLLSEHNLEVYYILATLEIINLGTIENPELFKGVNNITVETNLGNMNIEVEYVEDLQKSIKELENKDSELEIKINTLTENVTDLDGRITYLEENPSSGGGGEGGTTNYNALSNKPQINGVELVGNKTSAELGIVSGGGASNILTFENIAVETTAFVEDTTYEEFGYKAEIPCTGVTEDFFSDVTFNVSEALSGNYAPISLTGSGFVTIYAVEQPESTIIIPSIICSKGA